VRAPKCANEVFNSVYYLAYLPSRRKYTYTESRLMPNFAASSTLVAPFAASVRSSAACAVSFLERPRDFPCSFCQCDAFTLTLADHLTRTHELHHEPGHRRIVTSERQVLLAHVRTTALSDACRPLDGFLQPRGGRPEKLSPVGRERLGDARGPRSLLNQGDAIAKLQQLGITVVSVDEPITDDTAAGKLARNMLGAMNQFFSDSLSERIRFRMDAGFKEGRFLHYAPIGFLNRNPNLVVDPERGPLIRLAFEMLATGNYTTTDAVLKLVTSLGLRTRRGRVLTSRAGADGQRPE
jgi:hypothetical protein